MCIDFRSLLIANMTFLFVLLVLLKILLHFQCERTHTMTMSHKHECFTICICFRNGALPYEKKQKTIFFFNFWKHLSSLIVPHLVFSLVFIFVSFKYSSERPYTNYSVSIDLLLVLDFSVLNDFLSFFRILKVSFRLNIRKTQENAFLFQKKEQVLDFGIVIKLLIVYTQLSPLLVVSSCYTHTQSRP